MSKQETVKRAEHGKDNPYFLQRWETAQDRNLTFEARGMLSYILSRPDNWIARISDLQQKCGAGRVRRILKELIEAGYVEPRQPERAADGTITGWTPYVFHEMPQTPINKGIDPHTENPQVDNQDVDNQDVDNRTLHNIDKEDNKETTLTADAVEPSSNDLENDPSPKIPEYIHAWQEALPVKPIEASNPYNNRHYRKVAQGMIDAGYTPEHVTRYVKSVVNGFYKDKPLTFNQVGKSMPAWLQANPVQPQQSAPPPSTKVEIEFELPKLPRMRDKADG